jgi:hypothetical protein
MKVAEKIKLVTLPPKKPFDGKICPVVDPCRIKAERAKAEERAEIITDPTEIKQMQENTLNWLKKLNIGPLAQDFDTRVKKKTLPPVEMYTQNMICLEITC